MGKKAKRRQKREADDKKIADEERTAAENVTSLSQEQLSVPGPRRTQRTTKGQPPKLYGEWEMPQDGKGRNNTSGAEEVLPAVIQPTESAGVGVQLMRKTLFCDDTKSMKSNCSRASSYRRRAEEAEMAAAVELSLLQDKDDDFQREMSRRKLQREKELIGKRLALQKSKIAEDLSNDSQCGDERESVKSNSKEVDDWFQKATKANAVGVNSNVQKEPLHATVTNEVKGKVMSEVTTSTDRIDKFLIRQTIGRDLPIFDGLPEDWPGFIEEYRRTTEACNFTDGENLIRLRKCLKGKAKEAVQAMLIAPKNVEAIIQSLTLNFGHHNRIIKALIAKAKEVPAVDNEQPQSLIDFANKVRNLVTTADALGKAEHFRNPQLQDELIGKLPTAYKQHWVRFAFNLPEVDLEGFSIWLDREAAMANSLLDLELSKSKKKTEFKNAEKSEKKEHAKKTKEKVFATSGKSDDSSEKPKCVFCDKKGHFIGVCRSFAKIQLDDKWKYVGEQRLCFCCLEGGHRIEKCQNKIHCGEEKCTAFHHPVLHKREGVKQKIGNSEKAPKMEESHTQDTNVVGHISLPNVQVLLRVVPVILKGPKGEVRTYALFDDCSTVTMLDEELAVKIGAQGPRSKLETQWTNDMIATEPDSMTVDLKIQGKDCDDTYRLTNVRTVKTLKLPTQSVNIRQLEGKWGHLKAVGISSMANAVPKILIGEDHPHIKVARDILEGPPNAPIATKTLLGWVVHGRSGKFRDRVNCNFVCHNFNTDDDLDNLMKEHFQIENLGVKIVNGCQLSKEEKRVTGISSATTRRVEGRWETGLLWKSDIVSLPESKSVAMRRLCLLEKKMEKNPQFAEVYCQKIEDYVKKGYARKLATEEIEQKSHKTWYIPHFGVTNPNKPGKLRLVFDGASKSRGESLNDHLMKGMDLLNSLPGVLLKFRRGKIGFCGDIKEMYHQVKIQKEDLPAQRFLWRGMDRKREPDVFEMTVMTFGLACSPFSAQYVKNVNAVEFGKEFPHAEKSIIECHYMDDCLDSANSTDEAVKLIRAIDYVHRKGGFEMCNWICNSKDVLEQLPHELTAMGSKEFNMNSEMPIERVLGLFWNPNEDKFSFSLRIDKLESGIVRGEEVPTKRKVLKLIMSVFDPLGFLSYVMVKAKILMQDIWRSKIGWDELLNPELFQKWKIWIVQLMAIRKLGIPRCYSSRFSTALNVTLHVFCDASEVAISAVAYLRIEDENGVEVAFVMAKSRVAPIRPVSIPRLELQAALLGSRLANTIISELGIPITSVYFWTDSKTVLCWLRSAKRCKQFVAHRVGEMEETTDIRNWRWISSTSNVADDATRDSSKSDLGIESRWFQGPAFLKLAPDDWPSDLKHDLFDEVNEKDLELKQFVALTVSTQNYLNLLDLSRFSSWIRLVRTMAWFLRFKRILLRKIEDRNVKKENGKAKVKMSTSKSNGECCKKVFMIRIMKQDIAANRKILFVKGFWTKEQENASEKKRERLSTVKVVSGHEKIAPRSLSPSTPQPLELTVEEMHFAEVELLKSVQKQCFGYELNFLENDEPIPEESKLNQLSLQLNKDNLLVIRSRIEESPELNDDAKKPILLDRKHYFTKLLVHHFHKAAGHHGQERVVNEIRQKYWILDLRTAVRSAWNSCQKCMVERAKPNFPEMAPLPKIRVTRQVRPFTITGVDYFGPMEVTIGRRHEKRYGALFTCLTTRAVHLELADNLSTDSFIMALQRFTDRRGKPSEMYSDNGTNFRGADEELKKSLSELEQNRIRSTLSVKGIQWHFIPPYAPHMGGSWEQLVRSVKVALKATLNSRAPKEETLRTLMTAAEFAVNSRPLTHVAWDPDDTESLTPNHFLLGTHGGENLYGTFDQDDLCLRKQWRIAQALADKFWSRWIKEYLPTLSKRTKWKTRCTPVKVGDLVFIADGNEPRNHWPRGVITSVYPGKDGQVRVVDVKTASGTYRRPVVKICAINVNSHNEDLVEMPGSFHGREDVPERV